MNIIRCGSVDVKRIWASKTTIESVAISIGWAVDHCSHYLKGSDKVVTVVTDHFPLVALFEKCVFDLLQRLGNVRFHMMDQRMKVKWVPGKEHLAANALGRNPVWPGTVENSVEEGQDSGYEDASLQLYELTKVCA